MSRTHLISVIAIALIIHLLLGWIWTIGAALIAGLWVAHRWWILGPIAVGGSWLILVLYNLARAPDATLELWRVFGGLMGGLPGAITLLVTVLIGMLLGLSGALVGRQLRLLFLEREPA